jgi:hypothetical protein
VREAVRSHGHPDHTHRVLRHFEHKLSMIFPKILRALSAVALLFVLCGLAAAQQNPPTRITQPIDETKLTILKGNTHPLARRDFDRGAAPSNLQLNRMLLVLQRSPNQEAALKQFLEQQHNKSSSNYHAWLTAEQFGLRFGPADQDMQTVASWLTSHGLQINHITKGRTIIELSGTAEQLKEAFHTEIHKYEVNGNEHWANSSDPEIPVALAPVVAGIASLHNFPRKPLYRVAGTLSRVKDTGRYRLLRTPSLMSPFWDTGGTDCGLAGIDCYALAPYDFATIYNSLPLWNATSPIDGTGQTIAIVSQSDIYPEDFSDFRKDFGLPAGTLNIIHDGPDPGKLASEGDELESDLDVEWSGAVAKGATIDLVVSAITNTSAGVDLSALYIVDNNIAPVMSESYGACELDMGVAGNQFYNQLWQQAAAEGITAFVASGDSGSAGCDRYAPIATQGLAVSGISSTPYNIAVGGTDFDDSQNPSDYWKSTNNPTTLASAKSYIPESSWNDTCTNSEFFPVTGEADAESDCNDASSMYWPNFLSPVGGSGGASNCTTPTGQSVSSCAGGYAKPSWQSGNGVPSDGKRDVPDVSLFAADGLNGSFYVVCETDIYEGCQGEEYTLVAIGGTSASSPTFAGIMAMVNQETQSRQGNANYVLYPFAAQSGASCNSTGTVGNSCIFYDVTTGTIAMPCVAGSPDCVTNVAGDQNGALSGYSTTSGYDLATGLGSVNIANLVNNWTAASFQPTTSTLSLNPTTQIPHGSPVNVNLTVATETGTGIPTGLASLLTSTGAPAGTFTLSNGSANTTTNLLPGGSYTVTAHYDGDGTYAASDSSPGIPVTVTAEPSITTVQAFTLDQNGNPSPFTSGPYGGSVVYLRTSVAGQSGEGVPTGTVDLRQTVNGTTTNLPGDPFPLNSEGYTMNPLPGGAIFFAPGAYSIAATYSGDNSFNSGKSSAISFTITQAPTSVTTLIVPCSSQSGPCVLNLGTQVTIVAYANSSTSVFSTLPTGTMTFYSNGTPLAPPIALGTGEIPPVVSLTTSQLPQGLDNITAQYSGDTNFLGSTSSATLIDVGPNFTMTANPVEVSIASPGQSGSTTLTFVAQYGLTGSAALSPSMCSNLPSKSSCSFSPTNVTFTSSTTSVPVTLTITTTAASSAADSLRRLASRQLAGFRGFGALGIGTCVVLFGTRKRRWSAVAVFIVFAVIASQMGCGGGSSQPVTPPPTTIPGTPTGTYTGVTVSVTIEGVTQTINNLTVNVQ